MFQGDNGGPLVIGNQPNYTLIGVVSFVSDGQCASGKPTGFARITSFREWIWQHAAI
jgi:secreted trypsin-like serine protease